MVSFNQKMDSQNFQKSPNLFTLHNWVRTVSGRPLDQNLGHTFHYSHTTNISPLLQKNKYLANFFALFSIWPNIEPALVHFNTEIFLFANGKNVNK